MYRNVQLLAATGNRKKGPSISAIAGKMIQAGLLFHKVMLEVNDLVFDAVHFLLQFINLVDDHHPLIGIDTICDQGCQFPGPVVFQV
jgi:hypothetical protein